MSRVVRVSVLVILAFTAIGINLVSAETNVDDAALTEVGDGSNWLAYGRNYSEQRYSPLDQINHKNVGR